MVRAGTGCGNILTEERVLDEKVKVYIKLGENKEIVDIGSDIFLQDTEGYIKIDEGYGDRYVHAQGNYLNKPVIDLKTGKYNYKYEDGQIVENN